MKSRSKKPLSEKEVSRRTSQGLSSLMTAHEVADEAQMGLTKTWEVIGSGELEVVKIGRLTRITRASFDRWIARLVEAA